MLVRKGTKGASWDTDISVHISDLVQDCGNSSYAILCDAKWPNGCTFPNYLYHFTQASSGDQGAIYVILVLFKKDICQDNFPY